MQKSERTNTDLKTVMAKILSDTGILADINTQTSRSLIEQSAKAFCAELGMPVPKIMYTQGELMAPHPKGWGFQ